MATISVVTGGTGGMGITIAQHLAKKTKVVLCDLRAEYFERVKEKFEGMDVVFVEGNCSVREDVEYLVKYSATLGDIKNVIHTAGVSEYSAGKKNTPEFIASVNIASIINVVDCFADAISEGGTIVSIASMNGLLDYDFKLYGSAFPSAMKGDYSEIIRLAQGGSSATYTITKTFMRWYCNRNIARLAARGVSINTVSPGVVETPMTKVIEENSPGSISGMKDVVPMGRLGNTEDIARAVDYLVSATYVSGADILVDGGYSGSMKVDQFD